MRVLVEGKPARTEAPPEEYPGGQRDNPEGRWLLPIHALKLAVRERKSTPLRLGRNRRCHNLTPNRNLNHPADGPALQDEKQEQEQEQEQEQDHDYDPVTASKAIDVTGAVPVY